MDAGARGDGREENQWGGEIEVVIAWQTCRDRKKERRLYAGAGSERDKNSREEMKIVYRFLNC